MEAIHDYIYVIIKNEKLNDSEKIKMLLEVVEKQRSKE